MTKLCVNALTGKKKRGWQKDASRSAMNGESGQESKERENL